MLSHGFKVLIEGKVSHSSLVTTFSVHTLIRSFVADSTSRFQEIPNIIK